jgi:UDP-galactopyranose mutase
VSTFAPYAYHDILEIGHVLEKLEGGFEWTIARVPILTNAENRHYRAGYVGEPTTGYILAREGFVAFVLDELVNRKWIRRRPMLSSV